jgi:hypothetical protein
VRFNGYVQPFIGQNEGAQVRAATEEIGYDASKYTVRGNEWVVVVEERWNESDVDFGVLDGGVCGIEGFAVELKLIEISRLPYSCVSMYKIVKMLDQAYDT